MAVPVTNSNPASDSDSASHRAINGGWMAGMEGQQSQTPKDYGSAKAYVDEVRKWYNYTRFWIATQQQAMVQQQQLQLQHHYHQQQMALAAMAGGVPHQAQAGVVPGQMAPPNNGPNQPQLPRPFGALNVILGRNLPNLHRVLPGFAPAAGASPQPQTIIISQHTIPSLARRLTAELIDCSILFLVKLMIVYLLVEFRIVDLDQFEHILNSEASLQTLIDVTQDLFNVELLCKLVAGCLEAYCITYGLGGYPPGCTPGKWIMRIQVISCLDVHPIPSVPARIAVTHFTGVNFKSSLVRSLLKNVTTLFLFPLSAAFYFFPHNRAIYDLAAKTIVVNV